MREPSLSTQWNRPPRARMVRGGRESEPFSSRSISKSSSRSPTCDWHAFGQYYDPTLMAWHATFERNWPRTGKELDEKFRRMWSYYLLMCAGSFRADENQLWQIVLTKPGRGQHRCMVRE